MSRIGASITGQELFLLNHLARVNDEVLQSARRSATGKIVNSPKDDPSAYFQIQSFEKQLSLVNDLRANVETATAVAAEMQIGVDVIRSQLATIREKLLEDDDGSLTPSERDTNQAIIDEAVEAIRSATRTSVNGRRYLDGSFGYSFAGRNPNQIAGIDVLSLRDDTTIAGTVTTAATQATSDYFGPGHKINGNATFTLTGKRGSATISVVNNEALTAARDRINAQSHNTGITASVTTNHLTFASVDYGAEATIDIDVTSGTFATTGTPVGTDAVVTINGRSISSSDVDGNRVSFYDNGIHAIIDLKAGFTGAISSVTVSDNSIARFALSTRIGDQIKLALPSLFPELLGGVSGKVSDLETGGTLAGLGTNTSTAIQVIDEALAQLTLVDGRVSAFADVAVASAGRFMDALAEQLETSIDTINKVDDDAEALVAARYQSLAQNTVAAMAIMHEQQSYIFGILNQIAGLR